MAKLRPWHALSIGPSAAVEVVLHSSKAVDKTATKVAVWARGTAPDPGFGPRVEMLRGNARRQINLLGIGEGLPGEGFPAEEAPPAFLQIEPTGPRRDWPRPAA